MKTHAVCRFDNTIPVLVALLAVVFCAETTHKAECLAAEQVTQAEAPPANAGVGREVKRVGSVVGLNRETVDRYVILHKYVWPEVLERIRKSNIRNYSIYMGELDDGNLYLFSYFEYVGEDFEADMEAIAADPVTREWWKLTDPLQKRVKNTPTGSQWKTLDEVFHTD
jgi:L-rhamnose mutarotase